MVTFIIYKGIPEDLLILIFYLKIKCHKDKYLFDIKHQTLPFYISQVIQWGNALWLCYKVIKCTWLKKFIINKDVKEKEQVSLLEPSLHFPERTKTDHYVFIFPKVVSCICISIYSGSSVFQLGFCVLPNSAIWFHFRPVEDCIVNCQFIINPGILSLLHDCHLGQGLCNLPTSGQIYFL